VLYLYIMPDKFKVERERCGAFIVKNDKILLIKRIKSGRTYWVFPGGGREQGESLKDCLRREMHEELGLRVEKYQRCIAFTDFKSSLKEAYFLTEVADSKPRIVGEEKDRQSEENQYFLEFKNLSILDNENLYPPFARTWLKEYLGKSND